MLNVSLAPDHKSVVALHAGFNPHGLVVVDTHSEEAIQRISLKSAWLGLAWHPGGNEVLAAPSAVVEVWLAEFESALAEHRHITFTMHPEVIGRGHRLAALAALITAMRERATIWFARHDEVAEILNHA